MVKNVENPKRTISSLRKATNIPVTFKGDSSPLFPNLRGAKPRSKVVSSLWTIFSPNRERGTVKGGELELDISLLAAANFKNLWKITIWAVQFFHGGVDLNPLSTVHCPHSAVQSLYTVEFDASYITKLENRWQNRSNFFPGVFPGCLQCFEKQKYRFPSSKT